MLRDYGWVRTDDGRNVFRRVDKGVPVTRSSLPCPMIISDDMPPTVSMADGKTYTSKRAISEATRRAGYIEMGSEKHKPRKLVKPDRKAIRESIERARARQS